MQPSWKQVHPWIEAAVINLESTDALLQQLTARLSLTFRADCLIWTGLDRSVARLPQVYVTARAAAVLQQHEQFIYQPALLRSQSLRLPPNKWQQQVRVFAPLSLPPWLRRQCQQPRITQLTTEDLIIPAISGGHDALPSVQTVQFVIQLQRPRSQSHAAGTVHLSPFQFDLQATEQTEVGQTYREIQNWLPEEIFSLEVLCSQLILAYNALYWRQRLEQSRQQAALMGRITQLLNSSLNPDEVINRIVGELGQGMDVDRAIVVDLRNDPVRLLALWDHPDRSLRGFPRDTSPRRLWVEAIDMFVQGGASYLELDLTQDPIDGLQAWLHDLGVISALMVPLFIQNEFFGAVLLLSYRPHAHYQLDQLQTIRQVTDQAAIALTNAQHYQSLWTRQEALRIQNNSLQLEMIRDDLTGLLNRRSLEHELDELSTPAIWALQPPFSIITCDVDYFKLINDTHGHLIGDQVLKGIAERLQGQLRQGTYAYRYGGEEFVIILTETFEAGAVDVAERLRRTVSHKPFDTAVGEIRLTCSFGVAQQQPAADANARTVLHRADQALYTAKRQGRDRVCSLQPSGV